MIFLFTTLYTNTFKNNTFAGYLKLFMNFFRDIQIIVGPAIKVENCTAFNAVQMMMVLHVWVETLSTSECFDNIHDTVFRKGQKRSVYSIKGNMWIFSFHDLINTIGCGVSCQLYELVINRNPLGGNLQVIFLTDLYELINFI